MQGIQSTKEIAGTLLAKAEGVLTAKGLGTLEDIYKENLSDPDVQEFMEKYDITTDSETYQRGKSTIHRFVRAKDDPVTIPKLILVNENIDYTEHYRSERIHEYFTRRPKARYDKSTSHTQNVTFEQVEQSVGNIEALGYLKGFLENYGKTKTVGLWLVGSMGIGKTHIMGAFANELKDKNIAFEFLNVNNFLNELKEMMNIQGSNLEKRKRELIKETPVLIFDDIGVEQPTPWNLRTLQDIISARYDNDLPTFFTSNLTKMDYIGQFQGQVQPAVVERYKNKAILPIALEIGVAGKNWRAI